MEGSKRSNGDGTMVRRAIVVIIMRGILVLTVSFLSGCVIRPTPGEPPTGVAAGQTRSVIYVPVLILPPSNDDQDDRDQGPDIRPIPPVEIVRDRQKMAHPQGCQVMTRPRLQPPSARHATNATGFYKTEPKPEL